jgi:hypothetical protein
VSAQELNDSWRPGCPVGPESLRLVEVRRWGFDGVPTIGRIVVHAAYAVLVRDALWDIFAAAFPIEQMTPMETYDGSDQAAMDANNSSGFNCRAATGNPGSWSEHAFGRAVDINPQQNPYVRGSEVLPPGGAAYLDRSSPLAAGMVTASGPVVAAFRDMGWPWGGNWNSLKDYMHVSATGR